MKSFLILISIFFLNTAYSGDQACTLEQFTPEVMFELNLKDLSKNTAEELPLILRQQIIIAAKAFANIQEEVTDLHSVQDAIGYFVPYDGKMLILNIDGKTYTEISGTPNEMSFGFIFQSGGKKIIATDDNGRLICK
ncbi:MAG: hypothetical protein A2381_11120 [Bdellovibrionales bacterium RIFOXYB1_FULL_37_110]|nr:MAG: hypothetical protein A2181_01440 [Bdellovibrionales bacterium RIFOXYA1_FULL_38_20]OFZ48591.1 MAG: hypothetical protein A2417_09605 [Bdellovibrionales bacterium RIFOXYC1_FULL_37_79]OFZ58400.1 MAG: hypothetical protein A2381_11120 [Bdellovibrionales bacterium RIFOXYB1_FULL_37_110]OFZ62511.1 MAG: hypothetical protein A2577_01210 [Bdellovibrionales bacterium RIFOXYD1_FULL_36_51]